MTWQTLSSTLDLSVNHVKADPDGGMLESRYVQREDKYFICYLSSQTGCNYSCRFCHLTATGQTAMRHTTFDEYLEQAEQVMRTYQARLDRREIKPVEYMHFNFMARGEPLANPVILHQSKDLFEALGRIAARHNLRSRFLVSTIMPRDFTGLLNNVFSHPDSVPYYSLYSIDPTFRKRWLPKAMDPAEALKRLARFQVFTGRKVVLHWAIIKDQNDSPEDVSRTIDAVLESGLRAKFNLVRYNPFDDRHGEESPHVNDVFTYVSGRLAMKGSKIVPRVGTDVHASCGMFVH